MVDYEDIIAANEKVWMMYKTFTLTEQLILDEYLGGCISKDQALVKLSRLEE